VNVRETWQLIAQTSAAKIYWVLATLVTTAMTARFLGPAGRGVYIAATTWVTAFSTFGYLSLSQVVVYLAAGKPANEWLPRITGTLLTILGSIALLGWTLAAALYAWHSASVFKNIPPVVLLTAFAGLPFLLWIENGNGVLMALGKLHVLNSAQVAGATASLVLTFLFLGGFRLGILGGVAALVISQASVVAISLGYIVKQTPVVRFERIAARELLTGGAKLHLNAIGTYLLTQANVLIMNNYRSPNETAYYQLAVQMVTAMQIIPLAVSTVAYSLVSRDGANGAWPSHRRLIAQAVAVVAVLSIVAYVIAPFAIRIAFGSAFLPSVTPFRVMLLATVGMTFSIVMGAQWIGRGYFLQAALMTIVTGALAVGANLHVVPRWGGYGAAWVTVGTYALSIFINGAMMLSVQSQWRRSVTVA
jgi:O-antigen/teichoic acid export membrane protein